MPQCAVALSVELAHRQGDTDRQAAMLDELVSRGGSSVKPRMYLVQALIELGRGSDALKHLEVLLAEPTISPQERMQAGLFLLNLGHADRAIATAFQAYRDSPNVGPWRTSWPQVTREAYNRLNLLPNVHRECLRACRDFASADGRS